MKWGRQYEYGLSHFGSCIFISSQRSARHTDGHGFHSSLDLVHFTGTKIGKECKSYDRISLKVE